MRSRTSSSSFDMVRAPENCKLRNTALLGCTIALHRIVFQHDEGKFPEPFVVAAGLCEKLSCCNTRLSHLIRSWIASLFQRVAYETRTTTCIADAVNRTLE